MTMAPRISIVTLGVTDMVRARAFYERLGFKASGASNDNVTFFQLQGMALGLYGRAALAEDAHVDNTPAGFSGVTLAYNCHSEADVDRTVAHMISCGAVLKKQPQKVFWGGYSGYVADPDGHLWEIAYNPFFSLDAAGRLTLPA